MDRYIRVEDEIISVPSLLRVQKRFTSIRFWLKDQYTFEDHRKYIEVYFNDASLVDITFDSISKLLNIETVILDTFVENNE